MKGKSRNQDEKTGRYFYLETQTCWKLQETQFVEEN